MKSGRIASVKTYVPTYHGDGRADWTFAVVITFKDVAAFVGPSGDEENQRRHFPYGLKFLREERARFEMPDGPLVGPLHAGVLKQRPPCAPKGVFFSPS